LNAKNLRIAPPKGREPKTRLETNNGYVKATSQTMLATPREARSAGCQAARQGRPAVRKKREKCGIAKGEVADEALFRRGLLSAAPQAQAGRGNTSPLRTVLEAA